MLLLGGAARAEAPRLPDLQRIADAGKLVVAVVGTAEKPMVTRDEQGRLGGFDVELARAMVRALDVKAVFRQDAATPDGVVELVARGEADLGISLLSVTAQRAKHVLFSRPYATQHATVLIHRTRGLAFQRRCPEEKEILALAHEPDEVGVLEKSAYAGRVRDLDAKARTRKYESLEALFAAVQQGEVTMAFAGEIAARDYLRRQPAASIRLKLCQSATRAIPLRSRCVLTPSVSCAGSTPFSRRTIFNTTPQPWLPTKGAGDSDRRRSLWTRCVPGDSTQEQMIEESKIMATSPDARPSLRLSGLPDTFRMGRNARDTDLWLGR